MLLWKLLNTFMPVLHSDEKTHRQNLKPTAHINNNVEEQDDQQNVQEK